MWAGLKGKLGRAVPVLLAVCACSANGQTCHFVDPQAQFTAYLGKSLQIQVSSCETAASVVVSPDSESNKTIPLSNQGNGLWTGLWTPAVADSSVILSAIAVGADGSVVFVTVGGSVQQPPPPVALAQGAITFAVAAGGPRASQALNITNNDSQPHTVAVLSSGDAWLSLSSLGGTIQPLSTLAVPVTVDPSSLSPNSYSGSVTVTSDGKPVPGGVALISVAVSPPANPIQITASLYTLSFQLITTDSSSSQSVTLTNSNGTAVSVALQSSAPWLTVTPANFTIAATSSQILTLTATPGTLAASEFLRFQSLG